MVDRVDIKRVREPGAHWAPQPLRSAAAKPAARRPAATPVRITHSQARTPPMATADHHGALSFEKAASQ